MVSNYIKKMIKISIRDVGIPRGRKGWIDPDGNAFPLDNDAQLHGHWILSHYEEVKKKYPDFPPKKELQKYKDIDEVRDYLIERGWIDIWGFWDIFTWMLNENERQRIIDSILTKKIDMNYPIRVHTIRNEGDTFYLREENIEEQGIYAFENN